MKDKKWHFRTYLIYESRANRTILILHFKGIMSAIFSNTLKSQKSHLRQRKDKNNSPVF